MGYLLKGGTVVTFDPAVVERADLRIHDGLVVARAAELPALVDEEIIDVGGTLLAPGMVCAHTHLYSSLARGMPGPVRAPRSFTEILELIWWRLDSALDPEAIYYSALIGALEAARAGTTCLFDHHSSPAFIKGSLDIVREAIEAVGLRFVLCYEITDRNGPGRRDEGIAETHNLITSARRASETSKAPGGLFRGMVGAHASFTLSDESLQACAELMRQYDAGLHIHVAEDACDVEDARSKYGMGIVERLAKHGALNHRTILAHGTHLDSKEIALARESGVWFAHNPRSNMNNQVGYASVSEFGEKIVIGTDGIGADMFEEIKFAFCKNRDAGGNLGAEDWMRALVTNHQLASQAFRVEFGTLAVGSAADLIVMNYDPPTPMSSENLAWHLLFGLNASSVESVMVNGRFVIRDRWSSMDEADVYCKARAASEKLWAKLVSS